MHIVLAARCDVSQGITPCIGDGTVAAGAARAAPLFSYAPSMCDRHQQTKKWPITSPTNCQHACCVDVFSK